MFDGRKHTCVEGNHVVNIFSFSKAYGMMGWRVGYVSHVVKAYKGIWFFKMHCLLSGWNGRALKDICLPSYKIF